MRICPLLLLYIFHPPDLDLWNNCGLQHSDIDKSNFFTLSSFGVTHFLNEKPEFTELEQWKREHFLFNNIIKIHVFKKYRVWKSYKVMNDVVLFAPGLGLSCTHF